MGFAIWLGVIGYGAVAWALIERLGAVPVTEAVILIRSSRTGDLPAPHGLLRLRFRSTLDALLETRPSLIFECAGHSAVVDYAEACLRAGKSFVALSPIRNFFPASGPPPPAGVTV